MNKRSEKPADNLIMAIIIQIYIGWGLLFLIKFGVNHLTHNAYMGLIPAALIILPFFWIASDLARIFPNSNITSIFSRVWGGILGKVLAVIFWLYIVFYESICMRVGLLMVYTYFFGRTPFVLFSIIFIICILYPSLKGIHSISRLAGFTLLPPVFILITLEVLGLFNVNLLNIKPVFTDSIWDWCLSGMDLTLILVPGTAIFLYMHHINNQKNIVKISIYALGIVFVIFFLALFGTLGVFSPSITTKVGWSLVEYFHIIDYPYLLLEQAGLFFLITWFSFFFVAMSQGLFLVGSAFNTIFPSIKRVWYTVAGSLLVFLVVNIPLNIDSLETFLMNYQRWVAFSFLSILFLTWLVARLRLKK